LQRPGINNTQENPLVEWPFFLSYHERFLSSCEST
jgi:hypothetical protein